MTPWTAARLREMTTQLEGMETAILHLEDDDPSLSAMALLRVVKGLSQARYDIRTLMLPATEAEAS